jgi:hypothetical protein
MGIMGSFLVSNFSLELEVVNENSKTAQGTTKAKG